MAKINWKQVDFLGEAKTEKIDELNKSCENSILVGFTASNGHQYRTNRDDQTNMIGQKDELVSDPSILTVQWKTEDVGYVQHTKDEWISIYQEAFKYKKQQLFKYDTLKKQVNSCSTSEEIASVKW